MSIDAGEALGFKHWKRFQAERFRMKPPLGCSRGLGPRILSFAWFFMGFSEFSMIFGWFRRLFLAFTRFLMVFESSKVHEELPERHQLGHRALRDLGPSKSSLAHTISRSKS